MTINDEAVRKEIVQFQSSVGLRRLSRKDMQVELEKRIGKAEAEHQLVTILSNGRIRDLRVHELPETYDIFQCLDARYDIRVGNLSWFVRFLDTRPTETVTVLDGGCGPGYDILYLAHHYKDDPRYKFRGYDYQAKMLVKAEQNKEKLGLQNIELYLGKHPSPSQSEIEDPVDVLFTNLSIYPDDDGVIPTLKNIMPQLCRRIKLGGWYIHASVSGVDNADIISQVKPELELIGTPEISWKIGESSVHNWIYKLGLPTPS